MSSHNMDQLLLPNFLTAVIFVLLGLVCYSVSLISYRLFFHPLTKIPGPKLAAASYWYEFYHDLIAGPYPGQGAYNTERLHAQYGPVVRISPDELSVGDPDWFDVLYRQGRRDKWAKNSNANGSPGSVASTSSWHVHKARRAPLTPFFSKTAVRNLESIIGHKVDQLTSGMRTQYLERRRPLPVGVAFTALTLDVITDYCFGQSWRCLEAPDFAPEWKRTMTNLFEPVPVVKQFPWLLKLINALPPWVVERMNPDIGLLNEAKADVRKQVERILAEHEGNDKGISTVMGKSDDQPARTIFETILTSSLPTPEKTVDRLTDEAFVMIVAGGETTAKSLTNAVYHLLSNPKWLKLVVAEIDRAMPDVDRLPSSSELEQLPVLTAAIKETLRVSAPVTNRVQVLDQEQPIVLGDWSIPAGTPMSMSIPAIHLNPQIYKQPMVFNPGRFLSDYSSEKEVMHANKYYMPFHRGFRSCLGQNLSYAELYLGLTAMLRRFDIELEDVVRERDVDTVRDCFVGMPSPQAKPVQVRIVRQRQ